MELWPHQERALEQADAAEMAGIRRICVTSPTGGGKSLMMRERIRRKRRRTVLYTNRRMLREQLSEGMAADGIEHGIRASGQSPALLRDVQVSSIQTEESRVFKRGRWELHDAEEVHVDEAHNQKGGVAEKVLKEHIARGATVFGWTATPLDIGDLYDHLIIAGTNSELRACGAHVVCRTYGPDEPDTSKIKPTATGEYTEGDVRKVIMTPTIFGRVFDSWHKLNPDARSAILFAPGVPESMYFAEEFHKRGVPAAHIDGEYVWINGERMPSDQEARDYLSKASESGEVKVVCNRFVMREGIDWPWLYHCIMATVFGSPTSYLQAGGRLLRSHESLDHVLLQDHGGNWWRHGSLNADREWRLEYTARMVSAMREERLREKKEAEPIVCPECGSVRASGPVCTACGHRTERKSRRVMQLDGSLIEHEGDIFRPRKVKEVSNTLKLWEGVYWRAKKSPKGMTFNQAYALFYQDYDYWPPRSLPMMPRLDSDWHRKVRDVPYPSLIPKAAPTERQATFA